MGLVLRKHYQRHELVLFANQERTASIAINRPHIVSLIFVIAINVMLMTNIAWLAMLGCVLSVVPVGLMYIFAVRAPYTPRVAHTLRYTPHRLSGP